MSAKAIAIRTLYRIKRITLDGAKQAVEDGLINDVEFKLITGKDYA